MKKYDDNIPLLKNRVETHAFIRNISKHRLPDGTLDVEGNLKLWNDGMQGFVKTPLWEKTPGWREDTHLQGEPYLVFVPGNPGSPTILIAHGGGFSWRTGCEGPNVAWYFHQAGYNTAILSYRLLPYDRYLIVVSRGYDYEGNRLKSVQKTVKPPKEYTPKQAEKWVKEQAILFEREVQHTPEPINRSITLAKYIEHWVADVGPKKLADSTYQRDLQDIRRILPTLGNYKLTDLRKEVIRDFYEEMRHTPRLDGRGNLSEKSVEGLHNTLCGILSAAVDEGYLTHNPAWRCYKPKGQKKERPVADEETVKKLITAFEGQSMKYETYFKLVLATGLRRGEACGLKWSDINWRKRTIHVQRGVVKLSHQESITKDPKTTSGDRMVYLSKEMCQLLKAWRKECEWDRQQTANETVNEDDYLFRQPNGKPMNPCTFTYRFKLILKANNLPLNLNVHSLRHTNASLLIAQGVDVRTVASLLGHAQASTTLDIYAHAFDKNKRKAQEKLGKTIGL